MFNSKISYLIVLMLFVDYLSAAGNKDKEIAHAFYDRSKYNDFTNCLVDMKQIFGQTPSPMTCVIKAITKLKLFGPYSLELPDYAIMYYELFHFYLDPSLIDLPDKFCSTHPGYVDNCVEVLGRFEEDHGFDYLLPDDDAITDVITEGSVERTDQQYCETVTVYPEDFVNEQADNYEIITVGPNDIAPAMPADNQTRPPKKTLNHSLTLKHLINSGASGSSSSSTIQSSSADPAIQSFSTEPATQIYPPNYAGENQPYGIFEGMELHGSFGPFSSIPPTEIDLGFNDEEYQFLESIINSPPINVGEQIDGEKQAEEENIKKAEEENIKNRKERILKNALYYHKNLQPKSGLNLTDDMRLTYHEKYTIENEYMTDIVEKVRRILFEEKYPMVNPWEFCESLFENRQFQYDLRRVPIPKIY